MPENINGFLEALKKSSKEDFRSKRHREQSHLQYDKGDAYGDGPGTHKSCPGNPYESLLTDTSASIGNGRFLMTPESFLKNCKTKRDVADKVDFFHQYICAEPPGVWTDFFRTIEQRCDPLKAPNESYSVYMVDAADTYLISLLTTDTILKGIVIRAEGYRILVPSSKRTAFVSRLKSFGYLL